MSLRPFGRPLRSARTPLGNSSSTGPSRTRIVSPCFALRRASVIVGTEPSFPARLTLQVVVAGPVFSFLERATSNTTRPATDSTTTPPAAPTTIQSLRLSGAARTEGAGRGVASACGEWVVGRALTRAVSGATCSQAGASSSAAGAAATAGPLAEMRVGCRPEDGARDAPNDGADGELAGAAT